MGGSTIDVQFKGRLTWTNGKTHMTLGTGTSPLKQHSEVWLFSYSREGGTIIISLNQKLFLSWLPNRRNTQRMHVCHRSVLIQVCFFESTELFSLYHCNWKVGIVIYSGEGHKIVECFPGEVRDILIPYLRRIILFSSLNWKSPPLLPPANFWQVPNKIYPCRKFLLIINRKKITFTG